MCVDLEVLVSLWSQGVYVIDAMVASILRTNNSDP